MEKDLVSIIVVTHNRAHDVVLCLNSILNSEHANKEIIVIDNASTDDTIKTIRNDYGNQINLIISETNLMAGGGRNLGALHARGEYLLFIDSDNVIDPRMINELLVGLKTITNAGMVGPLMYYYKEPQKIWWAGADVDLLTSRTKYIGIEERDMGQFNRIRRVGHIPNIFLIKKDVWDEVGGIDNDYTMHYEESDLAEKVKRRGYALYILPRAHTWHNVPLNSGGSIRNYGGENNRRAYYTARNRILFMRKNTNKVKFFVFLSLFNNLFLAYYCLNYFRNGRVGAVKFYLRGTFDGVMGK